MTGQRQPQKKQQGYRRSRDEAEELFLSNMNLVHYVANRMSITVTEDTVQDGYIGLWKAALNFDDSRGSKFSSFAIPVIKNAIIIGWRERSRQTDANIHLEQPFLQDEAGATKIRYAETLTDLNAKLAMEELLLDLYLSEKLTEQEKTVAVMRMNGMSKTSIGRAFGHTDYWANDRIKSIRRKLNEDFNVKG